VINQQRNEILEAKSLVNQIANLREGTMDDVVRAFVPAESVEEQWDLPGLQKALLTEYLLDVNLTELVENADSINDEEIVEAVVKAAKAAFQVKLDMVGEEQFTPFMRMVLLQNLDSNWREHLAALDYLRQGIHLRGYAQKNPKQEYKREAFELFSTLIDTVKTEVTKVLLTVRVQTQEQAAQAAQAIEQSAEVVGNVQYTHPNDDGSVSEESAPLNLALGAPGMPRVGRNDPCPCGSGKRFKECHGKLV
jgi:preprotein translocase subunit SecA